MSKISTLIENCKILLKEYKSGGLGQTVMPEDSHPVFKNQEERLSYFTLPMALNYQRNSYALWASALKTWEDPETRCVFDVEWVSKNTKELLQKKLLKHKLALQPVKHISTWYTISNAVYRNFNTFENLFNVASNNFIKLREMIQVVYKKEFPYLSGPKIFNYWSFIISTYGNILLKNRDEIDIAPDTHITKCSVLLGVITEKESKVFTKEQVSKRWKDLLHGSGIDPIDMHPPLWFWSHNGFLFELPSKNKKG